MAWFAFTHEGFDGYRHALCIYDEITAWHWPRGEAWLRDQLVRAVGSILLNIAEGLARPGAAGTNQLRIADASAAEVHAALGLVRWRNTDDLQQLAKRVAMTLRGAIRRR
jgi:four helix bundle protein